MKRRTLLRHLRRCGCYLKREESEHSLWCNPTTGAIEAIPRHVEIPNRLADKICRNLAVPEYASLLRPTRAALTPTTQAEKSHHRDILPIDMSQLMGNTVLPFSVFNNYADNCAQYRSDRPSKNFCLTMRNAQPHQKRTKSNNNSSYCHYNRYLTRPIESPSNCSGYDWGTRNKLPEIAP